MKARLNDKIYEYEAKYAFQFRQHLAEVYSKPLSVISLLDEEGEEIGPDVYLKENKMYVIQVDDPHTYSYRVEDRMMFFELKHRETEENRINHLDKCLTQQGFVDLQKLIEYEKDNIFEYTFKKRFFYNEDLLKGDESDEDMIIVGMDLSFSEHDFISNIKVDCDYNKVYIYRENAYSNVLGNVNAFNVDVTDFTKDYILSIVGCHYTNRRLLIQIKKGVLKQKEYIDLTFKGFFLSDKKYRTLIRKYPLIVHRSKGYHHISNYDGEMKLISDDEMENEELSKYIVESLKNKE